MEFWIVREGWTVRALRDNRGSYCAIGSWAKAQGLEKEDSPFLRYEFHPVDVIDDRSTQIPRLSGLISSTNDDLSKAWTPEWKARLTELFAIIGDTPRFAETWAERDAILASEAKPNDSVAVNQSQEVVEMLLLGLVTQNQVELEVIKNDISKR